VDDLIDINMNSIAPLCRYVDPVRGVDMPALLCELSIDLGQNTATAILWG
jgi:hypothetical protein